MAKVSAEIIGGQLSTFRGQRGLSLREAASELGVSHQTIHLCEKGKRLPPLELLITAMDKWNVSFQLNGYQVVPRELVQARAPKPESVQGVLRLRPRGKHQGKAVSSVKYQAETVSLQRRDNELVITAVARITR